MEFRREQIRTSQKIKTLSRKTKHTHQAGWSLWCKDPALLRRQKCHERRRAPHWEWLCLAPWPPLGTHRIRLRPSQQPSEIDRVRKAISLPTALTKGDDGEHQVERGNADRWVDCAKGADSGPTVDLLVIRRLTYRQSNGATSGQRAAPIGSPTFFPACATSPPHFRFKVGYCIRVECSTLKPLRGLECSNHLWSFEPQKFSTAKQFRVCGATRLSTPWISFVFCGK